MKFKVDLWKKINDGKRSLTESIMVPEVKHTIEKWSKLKIDSILIGGLALSYHGIVRYTQDIDILFLSKNDIPNTLDGFKKVRGHSFQCNDTHVEVEVLDSDYLNIDQDIVKEVFKSFIVSNGIKIASPSSLVALKLQRFSRQDQADIEMLKSNFKIDLDGFSLTDKQLENYNNI